MMRNSMIKGKKKSLKDYTGNGISYIKLTTNMQRKFCWQSQVVHKAQTIAYTCAPWSTHQPQFQLRTETRVNVVVWK